MRLVLPLLASLTLLLTAPPALADDELAHCDVDDDLYNHCHVGPVHWVTGPLCAGVNVGDEAACADLGHD